MTIEQKIQEASDMTLPYSVRKQIAQAIDTWLKDEIVPEEREDKIICPDCDGQGWTAEHAGPGQHSEDGECLGYCPVQEPCERCEGKGHWITSENEQWNLCRSTMLKRLEGER